MDLDGPWRDTGWAGPAPCRQAEGCDSQGVHELGFLQPLPHATLPQRRGAPWVSPTLTNPVSSSRTLLSAAPRHGPPAWGKGHALD